MRIILCLCALLSLLPSCASNPATKGHDFVLVSEKEELNLGKQLNIQGKPKAGVLIKRVK